MKNESFDIKRFSALFVRFWAEKKVVVGLYGLITIAALVWVFIFYQDSFWENKKYDPEMNYDNAEGGVHLLYFFFIVIQMSIVLGEYMKRKSAATFTLIPAAQSEKFVCLLVNSLILPTLVYFGLAVCVDNLVFKYLYPYSRALLYDAQYVEEIIKYEALGYYIFAFSVLTVFLNLIVLRKNHLIYAIVGLVAGGFILESVNGFLVKHIVDANVTSSFFAGVNYMVDNFIMKVDRGLITDYYQYSILPVILYLCGMLYATYLKFKEKQQKV